MLYQPFTNAQMIQTLSNQAEDNSYLIIQSNPLLNALTYCVSNKDISSMKKSSSKNFSTSLSNNKKSKQSVR